MRTFALVVLSAMLAPTAAQAQTLIFDGAGSPGSGLVRGVGPYTEAGFTINGGNLGIVNTPDYRYTGTPSMWDDRAGGTIILTNDAGVPFAISAMDIDSLNGPNAAPVDFVGLRADGTTASASFTTDTTHTVLETFLFPPDFVNLVSLSWVQASPYHQFDNIVLSTGGPQGLNVVVSTSCPNGGAGAITWFGATPSSNVAILAAGSAGSFAVPGGPCAGTITGLGPASLIGILPSDANGVGALSGVHQQTDCGTNLQVLDVTTCALSNVAIAQ